MRHGTVLVTHTEVDQAQQERHAAQYRDTQGFHFVVTDTKVGTALSIGELAEVDHAARGSKTQQLPEVGRLRSTSSLLVQQGEHRKARAHS